MTHCSDMSLRKLVNSHEFVHRTVLAVSGPNFVVVAGDTRLSNGGYSISSRNVSKLFSMYASCVCRPQPSLSKLVNLDDR